MACGDGDSFVAGSALAARRWQVEQRRGRRSLTGSRRGARARADCRKTSGTAPRLDAPERVAPQGTNYKDE